MNGAYEVSARAITSSDINVLRVLIAKQLADGHGRAWEALDTELQAAYLGDAEELVDQGLGAYWQDPGEPPEVLSAQMEAEVFAFDQAMTWFYGFLDDCPSTSGDSPKAVDVDDPVAWDAWVTVLPTSSELVRRAWARRVTENTTAATESAGSSQATPAAMSMSIPDAGTGDQLQARVAAAIAATLANRHQRRWMDLADDWRGLYLRDAQLLIDAGLSALR